MQFLSVMAEARGFQGSTGRIQTGMERSEEMSSLTAQRPRLFHVETTILRLRGFVQSPDTNNST
jgi:hypothetical protein